MATLRFVCLIMLGLVRCGYAQTNAFAFCLVDTPPINGQGDSLQSGFWVGELVNEPLSGLFRSELLIPLPAMPTNSQLASAVIALNFAGSSGTNGNPSFGPLSVYCACNHSVIDATDYSSTNFLLITNAFLTPFSPPSIYNLDITSQVATNYATTAGSSFLALRFQVNGLQYDGVDHFYEFNNFTEINPYSPFPVFYPDQLALQFSQLSAPCIACYLNRELGLLILHWPSTFSNYALESANVLNPTRWNTVTNPSTTYTNNNEIYVGVSPTNNQCFFRLSRQ